MSNIRTRFVSNTIANTSLGVYVTLDNDLQQYKGTLIRFINMMAVDFISNTIMNVGGFTLEDLNGILIKIKNERTTLDEKWFFPYATAETTQLSLRGMTFFTKYLSNSLISVFAMSSLRIIGSSTFRNIYMIDRLLAMLEQKTSVRTSEFGLILILNTFKGSLKIGDDDGNLVTTFSDLIGYFNPFSIEKNRQGWAPVNWKLPIRSFGKDFEYGLGSTMFNIYDSENYFSDITIQNAVFKSIYHRRRTQTSGSDFPGILSTCFSENHLINRRLRNVTLHSIVFLDLMYESGPGHFKLCGETVNITNITATNIGNMSFYSQPMMRNYLPITQSSQATGQTSGFMRF